MHQLDFIFSRNKVCPLKLTYNITHKENEFQTLKYNSRNHTADKVMLSNSTSKFKFLCECNLSTNIKYLH